MGGNFLLIFANINNYHIYTTLMKPLNRFSVIALAAISAGLFVSCSNEMSPDFGSSSAGAKLLRAPEFRAWSGGHTFGTVSRGGEVIGEYYEVMPDFTPWCNSWWPEGVSVTSPTVPSDAIEVNASNYSTIKFESGKTYVLEGELKGFSYWNPDPDDPTSPYEGIFLNNIPDNVTIYVNGGWAFFNDSKARATKANIIVLEESEIVAIQYEGDDTLKLRDLNIYNFGSAYIYYDTKDAIGEGCTIYNLGQMVIEQNYVDDNGDLSLDPITIKQPIYSGGGSLSEVYFKGGVVIDTDKAYFRKVCVDGQMTVETGATVHTGYLNADELYGHDNSKVDMAPEGMIVAGTISMKRTAQIVGKTDAIGFITTNEIIGIRKTTGTVGSKMESEVDKDNFSTIFKNVDIYVTRTINNTQDLDEIRSYKAENGTTYALDAETEFDASENDDVRNGDVNGWDCGIGYRYVRKAVPGVNETPDPETPETPDPETPENPDPETPDQPAVTPDCRHDNEVEVNLSLNDSHSNYTKEDLVSKLSIHVRYPGDVEVFIPVPQGYYCDVDDFDIREGELFIPGANNVLTYEIAGKTVTLTVNFEAGGIRVTTDGIDQDVLDFCMDNYGDGVNFEVYNYYGLYEMDAEGNYVRAEDGNIAREKLLEYLNAATVEFLDNPTPDYYINAFNANREGEGDHDCTVSIVDGQKGAYGNRHEGGHLNDSDWNQIYTRNGVNPDHAHSAK